MVLLVGVAREEGNWLFEYLKLLVGKLEELIYPSKIEWDLTKRTPKQVARANRYSGLGVRSVEISWHPK